MLFWTRLVIFISGLIWVLTGVSYLWDPGTLQEFLGQKVLTPAAATEYRAMYGGLSLCFGVWMLYGTIKTSYIVVMRQLLLYVIGTLAIVRLFAACIDSTFTDQYIAWVLIYEWLTFILLIIAIAVDRSKDSRALTGS